MAAMHKVYVKLETYIYNFMGGALEGFFGVPKF